MPSLLNGKKAMVYVSPSIILAEFKNTFRDKFGTAGQFAGYLGMRAKEDFGRSFNMLMLDYNQKKMHKLELESSYDNVLKTMGKMLKDAGADYLFHITLVHIGSRYSSNFDYTTGNGSRSESCLVRYTVKIVDVRRGNEVASFDVEGTQGVILFAFESALMGAIESSLERSLAYMSSGQTDF
jgi:hypothetical protein